MKINFKNKNIQKTIVIILIFSLILIGNLFLVINCNNRNIELSQNIISKNNKIEKLKKENDSLKDQKQIVLKNEDNSNINKLEDINQNLSSLFNTLYTFDNNNYLDRASKAKTYLSDELYRKMFPKDLKEDNLYDNISSTLINFNMYNQSYYYDNNNILNFLVDITYESKNGNDNSTKHSSIYKVQYDKSINKVISLDKLNVVSESGEY